MPDHRMNTRERSKRLGFSLSLNASSEAEAGEYFKALSDGGEVEMALEKTPWSPCFGVVTDRFGVSWMIGVAA